MRAIERSAPRTPGLSSTGRPGNPGAPPKCKVAECGRTGLGWLVVGRFVRREWEPEELIGSWTLVEPDWKLVANKSGATRLGFSALLKFFEIEGRFPEYAAEVPERAVVYLAEQVKVDSALFVKYEFSSRAAK